MTNVIKHRQLNNGEKLTPKTDFVYQYFNDIKIFNTDGTTKQALTSGDQSAQYTKVGKGQFVKIEVRGNEDDTVLHLNSWADPSTPINTLKIDRYWGGGENYWNSRNIITFLGQPFLSEGDNDRYIIIQKSVSTGGYYPALVNIDTGKVYETVGSGFSGYYDFIYDGNDTVYFNYLGGGNGATNQRIISMSISKMKNLVDWDGQFDIEVSIKDDTGSNVLATRVYGINDATLFYESQTGELMVYDIASKVSAVHRPKASNMIMTPGGLFNGNYIYSQESASKVVFQSTNPWKEYDLTPTMVAYGLIGNGETQVSIPLVLNYKETDTTITIMTVFVRNATNPMTIGIGEFIIDKNTNAVTMGNRLWWSGTNNPSQDEINNIFKNTCNTYGVGKFYNYGLQKQWDDYHA